VKARPALAAGAADPKADEAEELRQLLALSPEDLEFLDRVRGDAHRLALALQLVWTRAERVLATDPASLPAPVIATAAAQLGVDPEVLGAYRAWPTTRAADNVAVCEHLGVRPFDVDEDGARLGQVLREKVAHTGSTAALLDAAEDWLVRQGLLRPTGESTIERLLYSARAAAEEELFAFMAGQLTQSQAHSLDELCRTNGQDSEVARLSVPSRVPSARAVADDCERLERIRAVLPPAMDWGSITANRRRQWAAVVRRQTAQALRRYKPPKRRTLLLAFLVVRGEEITDAVVEMFDALIGRTFARSQAALIESRLDQAQAQTEGVRMLRTIAEVLLDPAIPPEAVRNEIFRRVPRERVSAAVEQAAALDTSQAEAFFGELAERYPYIRSFAPLVLRTLSFASARAGNEVLEALEVLAGMNAERRLNVPADAPLGVVPRKWQRVVVRPEGVDRRAWEFSVLSEARAALRAGDLTVGGSRRFTPWDGNLYTPAAWEGRRSSWLAEAGLPASGEEYAAGAIADLDGVTTEVARRLPSNASVRIERGKLVLTALEKVEVPPETEQARAALMALLRTVGVGLPDLLMEVDRWTGFISVLTHLTGRRAPSAQHQASIRPALFAVLIAEATNIGLATMARASGIPVGQLTRVADWYLREDTLRSAISALVHYHRGLPLTEAFGTGTTSSSDGIRFGVAASTLNARYLPRAFARRRGITVMSHVSDQGTQYWVDVVNCQLREATFVLDGLLYHDAPPIEEHYTDTEGFTDLVFGLCTILGKRFAPRLRDLPDQALYRARRDGDYGPLNPLLRQSVRSGLIARHWDDLNRLAASLKDGLATPSLIVSRLQAMQRQNPLQQALQEVGRIAKTRHILTYVDDERLRRRVLVGLNKQERVHNMARDISFGRQGRYADRGYEAQLNRASALSLVINAIIVWNTRYLAAAADELARRGQPIPASAWTHLTPLLWEHVHFVGSYLFEELAIVGELRPLDAAP
jgi:TnpA family transposase